MRALWWLLVAGCGRIGFDSAASIAGDGATDGPPCELGGWSSPELQDAISDAVSSDFSPTLSPDRLELFFASDRVEPGEFHLYRATRDSTAEKFSNPTLQTFPFDVQTDPEISSDGKTLYYIGLSGGVLRLVRATRTNPGDAFTESALVDEFVSNMRGPTLSRDSTELFFTDENEIVRATFAGTFTVDRIMDELQVTAVVGYPGLSADGLEIYFEALIGDGAFTEMYTARRDSIGARFETPTRVDELSSDGDDDDPDIANDNLEMTMSSSRAGTADIYLATRGCK